MRNARRSPWSTKSKTPASDSKSSTQKLRLDVALVENGHLPDEEPPERGALFGPSGYGDELGVWSIWTTVG